MAFSDHQGQMEEFKVSLETRCFWLPHTKLMKRASNSEITFLFMVITEDSYNRVGIQKYIQYVHIYKSQS